MSKTVAWGYIIGQGDIVCECDQCGEGEEIPFSGGPDFKAAQEELKAIGWISRKIDDKWYDFCSEKCYYNWIKENK